MTEIPKARLADLVNSLDHLRRPVRSQDRKLGPFPYYGASGIVDHVSDYLFEGLHLLIAEDGENLRTRKTPIAFLADGRFWVNNHAHVVQANEVADTRYLSYAVEATDISGYLTGSTQPKLTKDSMLKLEVPAPSRDEQRAIAGVLGALDDKIESNRRILETAKRLITAEHQYVVSSVDDEPYGVRLDVQMGAPFKGEYFSEIGYGRPLIRIRDLKTFSSQVWTTESRADEIGIVPGDILVGMDAEFRSTIWLGDAGVLNQRMCRFVPRKGVSRSFAWLAIQPELEYCERAKSGTTVIHLNKGDIDQFRVPRLSDEQHEELSMVTEPVFDRLVVAGREISSLSGLRDALLPELLAGRLRVRDAERVVEEVV